jgi:hypothetical protein
MFNPMQVTLISADRQKFEVDIEVAKMSQTIENMVEGERLLCYE